MKLSLRSKLMARATPGFNVLTERPIAESASVLIIPPCTKPEWLAMSSVGVISTTAVPSPVSATVRPSQVQALDGAPVSLLTALPLRYCHARRPGPRHQPALFIKNIGLAEQQGLFHLNDPTLSPQAAFDHRAQEIDLELDGGVLHSILLKRRQRHSNGGVRDLRDDPALDHADAVPVLRPCIHLEDHPPGLGLRDPCPQRLHPPVSRRGFEGRRAAQLSQCVPLPFTAAAGASPAPRCRSLSWSCRDRKRDVCVILFDRLLAREPLAQGDDAVAHPRRVLELELLGKSPHLLLQVADYCQQILARDTGPDHQLDCTRLQVLLIYVKRVDRLLNRFGCDSALRVVSDLPRPPPLGFVDRQSHRIRDLVGVHDH